jgi:hypothetical protein
MAKVKALSSNPSTTKKKKKVLPLPLPSDMAVLVHFCGPQFNSTKQWECVFHRMVTA